MRVLVTILAFVGAVGFGVWWSLFTLRSTQRRQKLIRDLQSQHDRENDELNSQIQFWAEHGQRMVELGDESMARINAGEDPVQVTSWLLDEKKRLEDAHARRENRHM